MFNGLKGKAAGVGKKALRKMTSKKAVSSPASSSAAASGTLGPGTTVPTPITSSAVASGATGPSTTTTNVALPAPATSSSTASAGAASNSGTSSAATSNSAAQSVATYAAMAASAVASSVVASSAMSSSTVTSSAVASSAVASSAVSSNQTLPDYYGLDEEDSFNNTVPPPPPPSPNARYKRRRIARILINKLSYPSTPKPQPPTFHKFANLPAELRIKIWEYHIMDTPGRIVQVQTHPECGECTSATPMPRELKGALLACQESRHEVNRLYPQCFGTPLCPPKIRFNFERDIFYLNTVAMPIYFLKAMRSISEEELNSIRRWALPYFMWTQFTITRIIDEAHNNLKDKTSSRAYVRFNKQMRNPKIKAVHLVGQQDCLMGLETPVMRSPIPIFPLLPLSVQELTDQHHTALQYHLQHTSHADPAALYPYLPSRYMHHLPYGRIDANALEFMDVAPLPCYTVPASATKRIWDTEVAKLKDVPIFLSFVGYNGVKAGRKLPSPRVMGRR